MADVIVIGGGVGGLATGMLLARDGHDVRLLERDPEPPPSSPDQTWRGWERRGVTQFRMLHAFLPRFRELLQAELPDVVPALVADGALRGNRVLALPEKLTGGARPGDERFDVVTGRRPMMEATLARVAADHAGLTICRGVAVRGLLEGPAVEAGVPHVGGVVTDDGHEWRADLVIDAGGRRSPVSGWVAALGARPHCDERAECGWIYYGRHFRSPDGTLPASIGPPLQPYESLSWALLAADNGTWGVGLVTSADDPALRAARHVEVWHRLAERYPVVAHWTDGEPISDVDVMAGIEDRRRRYFAGADPVVTGVVPVADAWACTNPSLGRGASIGLRHAVCLRDSLRDVPATEAREFVTRFDERTTAEVEPLYRDAVAYDRHRLGQVHAQIAGTAYETEDPGWAFAEALRKGAGKDPDLLRAYATVGGVLERGVDVAARPGVVATAMALGTDEPLPGLTRAEVVALVTR